MLGTLADVYANPIMVDALILGREGTTSFQKIRGLPSYFYAPNLPGIDDEEANGTLGAVGSRLHGDRRDAPGDQFSARLAMAFRSYRPPP